MKFFFIVLIFLKLSLANAIASENIYIRVSYGDTLSSLLFSVGSTPLYREVGAVEIHQVVFKSFYENYLEIGQSAPILKSSIRFHENLIKLEGNLYDIKERIRTLDDYRNYLEKRSNIGNILDEPVATDIQDKADQVIEKHETILPKNIPVDEKKKVFSSLKNLRTKIGLGYRFLDRKITQGALDTKTQSNGQPFLGVDSTLNLSLISTQARFELQPWLGGSEGLSSDYLFGINQYLSDYRLSPLLGIKYEKSGFISRDQSVRIANASESMILDFGMRFSLNPKMTVILAYELGLKTDFEIASGDLGYKGLLVHSEWHFHHDWSLSFEYRHSTIKRDEELKLTRSGLSTRLSYGF